MKCERAQRQLSPYMDGDLSATARPKVEAHLEECADCRAIRAEYAALVTDLASLRDAVMPYPGDALHDFRLALAAQDAFTSQTDEPLLERLQAMAAQIATMRGRISLVEQGRRCARLLDHVTARYPALFEEQVDG